MAEMSIEDLHIELADKFLALMYKANAAEPYVPKNYDEAQAALVSVLDIITNGDGYKLMVLCIDNGEDVRYNLKIWREEREGQ